MKERTIAGIRRGNLFSPNHIGNDAAIFSLTADYLRGKGYTVNEYIESDLLTRDLRESFLFNMVRDRQSIRRLQQFEDMGRVVVNSGYGIENCTREKMTRLLLSHAIPHPRSLFLPTGEDPVAALEEAGLYNCWVKRGDFHAIHREDVTYVRHPDEAKGILKEFAMRGIEMVVVNEHLVGDLVKFYGVAETDFFYWFYPSDMQHSKFGLEQINGTAQGFPFDAARLYALSNEAAKVLNIRIYGGDCIVSEDGSLRLIDFNDWPSFAPCRNEAVPYIARIIMNFLNHETLE
ncbi:MAG: hypothetical protein LBT83_01915 [Tannerella sp.]|jgi:hypothetical protein|nr:hypothetical protein [Tannerella sp.]